MIVIVLSCNIMVKSLARKSLGQYAGLPKNKETDRMNVTELMYQLNITYTNTYSFLLWDTNGNNYLDLVLLLDYLAFSLVQNGWSIKKLVRQIVSSRAYQLSARVTQQELAFDAENQFYGRRTVKRLRAEDIRD